MPVLLGLLLLALFPSQPSTVRITVRLLNVRPAQGGVLHVGLHREPGTGFPGPSPFMNQDVAPTGTEVDLNFDAPPGAIAVAVHHDANSNGKLDANFIGIPKEGYGVTNDPRPKFRAPRFAEGRVVVTRDTALTVRLRY